MKRLHQLVGEMSQDLQFMAATLTNHAVDANRRFRETGDRIEALSAEVSRIGMEARDGLYRAAADSEERFNQLSGRVRLMDQRLQTFLALADRDRGELRGLYRDLEKRVSALEKRSGPDDAVA